MRIYNRFLNYLCLFYSNSKMKRRPSSPQSVYAFFERTKKDNTSASDFYAQHLPKEQIHPKEQENILQQSMVASDICAENNILEDVNLQLKSQIKAMQGELEKTKKQNAKYLRDLESMKKLLNKTSVSSASKEAKIRLMQKKCQAKANDNGNDPLIFGSYENILGMEVLKQLRKLGDMQRNDSTFVLKVVQKLYLHETEKLKNKRACGRLYQKGYEPISPQKKGIIAEIFRERLNSLNLNEGESTLRLGRLNELINIAIKNSIRRQNDKQNSKNVQEGNIARFEVIENQPNEKQILERISLSFVFRRFYCLKLLQ